MAARLREKKKNLVCYLDLFLERSVIGVHREGVCPCVALGSANAVDAVAVDDRGAADLECAGE